MRWFRIKNSENNIFTRLCMLRFFRWLQWKQWPVVWQLTPLRFQVPDDGRRLRRLHRHPAQEGLAGDGHQDHHRELRPAFDLLRLQPLGRRQDHQLNSSRAWSCKDWPNLIEKRRHGKSSNKESLNEDSPNEESPNGKSPNKESPNKEIELRAVLTARRRRIA